jgi:hypothetical protein
MTLHLLPRAECPECGGLHSSRGLSSCHACGRPTNACEVLCGRCADMEIRLDRDWELDR